MVKAYMPTPEEIERLKMVILEEHIATGRPRCADGMKRKSKYLNTRVPKAIIPPSDEVSEEGETPTPEIEVDRADSI